jgi:glyoxylase-like metal-dependent hydrolase (beta-lactamase superfamily II)
VILSLGGRLQVACLPLGELMTNCWVLSLSRGGVASGAVGRSPGAEAETDGCWVVDPGDDRPLIAYLGRRKLRPGRILITHGHGDHIAGLAGLKARHPAAIVTAPAGDAAMLGDPELNLSAAFGLSITAPPADELVGPGQELTLGELSWRVLDVSGHSPGGVAFYCAAAGAVIAGDALFAESIGRTDIPGADAAQLLHNIRRHLLSLPDATRVLPGHGPPTTIGQERLTNPFLL